MKIHAIVYTSSAGHTAQYAKMLGEKTGLPVYAMAQAKEQVAQGETILYMGWIRASTIMGYKQAASRWTIACIAAVGMGETGDQIEPLRKKNKLPADVPLFTMMGGLNIKTLKGIDKLIMRWIRKSTVKFLTMGSARTESEEAMLIMFQKGASYVSEENMQALLDWYAAR